MPITILLLVANPADTYRLKLDEEARAIDTVLRQGAHRNHFELCPHWAVRYADLQEQLLCYRPEIVHFCGHGDRDSAIVLKDAQGATHSVPPVPLLKDDLYQFQLWALSLIHARPVGASSDVRHLTAIRALTAGLTG